MIIYSYVGVQASRCGVLSAGGRVLINDKREHQGPRRAADPPEREETLPSSSPCRDGGRGLPDVLNSKENTHVFIL